MLLKKLLSVALIIGLFAANAWSQGALEVKVNKIKKNTGYIMLALYDSEDTFLGEEYFEVAREEVKEKGSLVIKLEDLPYGEYAITVFHDENGNEDLDTNAIGIPREPYGFSNNARGFMGPPKYQAASFEYRKGGGAVEINLR